MSLRDDFAAADHRAQTDHDRHDFQDCPTSFPDLYLAGTDVLLSDLRARGVVIGRPPDDCRLILANVELLDTLGTRAEDGRRLSYEWGEPAPEGWYVPTVTATDDGAVFFGSRVDLEARVAEALLRIHLVGYHPDASFMSAEETAAAIVAAMRPEEEG